MAKKLWDKGFQINQKIEDFTVGQDRELDLLLAHYDVMGNKAQAKMLASIGLLTEGERDILIEELDRIDEEIEKGQFIIEEGIEDVHSQVEYLLTTRVGEAGKKIHSGRSRNDQVLLDLKLFYRDVLSTIADKIESITRLLLQRSEETKAILMPGYTHMQVAMPSSFGLWFGAYAETLIDDLATVQSTRYVVNQNPLGSAAGYGSSFPLDREMITKELGFRSTNYNSIHAQMGRGKSEQYICGAVANYSHTLAKFCMDVCLYNGQDYGFFTLPKEYTTGSSIMPHKKNPDVFELLRARFNHATTLPAQILSVISNLSTGYHRDLQLLKEILFPALQTSISCLDMIIDVIPKIEVKDDLLDQDKYQSIYSVEKVNEYVMSGLPFREAYRKVAEELDQLSYEASDLNHTHVGSIGNLATDKILKKLESVVNLPV